VKSRLALFVLLAGSLSFAQVSVTTNRNSNYRDGQNLNESILTPTNVNVSGFGKLFSQPVDGYVYAQPLYVSGLTINGAVHNVVFVATEHDSVYAFDADSNTGINAAPLWHTSFLTSGIQTVSSSEVNCTDIVPEIGITGTPVIDLSNNTLYVVAKTNNRGKYQQHLHALNILTGAEQPGSPVLIKAKVRGTGQGSVNGMVAFDPLMNGQRPGLLLLNGDIYIAWASHCDNQPYHGWIMSYSESTLQQIAVHNTTPNGGLGGIWQSGGGVAADSSGRLFLATGNGTFDANQSGGKDLSDSILRLIPSTLQINDYFTPYNQQQLSSDDTDVGSGGVLLIPDQPKGSAYRHLMVQVGKEGSIYVINRDNLGKYNPNGNMQIVQDMENAIGGMWATPAFWNNYVYFGGSYDYVRQYSFDPSSGLLSAGAIYTSPTAYGFPGTSPSISANGTSNAILWTIESDGYAGGNSIMHAYAADDIADELYNSNMNPTRDAPGTSVKFTVPTVANGKVYVPATSQISVYGLLNQ
jgi:hypothetical protein